MPLQFRPNTTAAEGIAMETTMADRTDGFREGPPGIGKWPAFGNARRYQVARTAVQRHREFPSGESRAIDDRIVITSDKACGISEPADSDRNEIGLEELPCGLGIQTTGFDRAGADLFECGAYRSGICRVIGCGLCTEDDRAHDRMTTCIERRKRRSVIVARPAIEIAHPTGSSAAFGMLNGPAPALTGRSVRGSEPVTSGSHEERRGQQP